LAAAERFRALAPGSRLARYERARALVGLGQASEAELHARALLEAPLPREESPLLMPVMLGIEFAAHGYAAPARRLFELAVDWPDSPAGRAWITGGARDDAVRRAMQGDVASALYELGRWHDARVMFERLSAADTASADLRASAAIAAARDGDRRAIASFTQWLNDGEARGTRPEANYFRARLAVVLGDDDAAVRQLNGVSTAYHGYYFEIHRESDFRSLRDDPRLRELIRPSK
jgi:hypothetical protein